MTTHRNTPSEEQRIERFKEEVKRGLTTCPKRLPSKYFYDERGSALFMKIMDMPEYYLTRAEFEILSTKTHSILCALGLRRDTHFELIELGAGDGSKTRALLSALSREHYHFSYSAIDICQHALGTLQQNLSKALPGFPVYKRQGDYFEILASLKGGRHPKVILFLGSNLGNMTDAQAGDFIHQLSAQLNPGDHLLLGLDLIKDPSIISPAYQDAAGLTRDFNLNLLLRINRELGGDFKVDNFRHSPHYDACQGVSWSYLESTVAQEVKLSGLEKPFSFKKGEKIHTEISRKYDDAILRAIIADSELEITAKLTDSQDRFADYILIRQARENELSSPSVKR